MESTPTFADIPHMSRALGHSTPLQGILLPAGFGYDIVPLIMTQCEPWLVFYNLSLASVLSLYAPDGSYIIAFTIPSGTGHLNWTATYPLVQSYSQFIFQIVFHIHGNILFSLALHLAWAISRQLIQTRYYTTPLYLGPILHLQ
jgi:hypothetical protein